MKIKKVSIRELDYINAICLDPSVGKKEKAIMHNAMIERISWIKEMTPEGLEIFIATEEPQTKIINYKWAGKIKHSELSIHGLVPMGLLEALPIEKALEPIEGKRSLFINCMWVLPPFWLSGVGKSLLEFFLQRAKMIGGASLIAYEEVQWFGTSIKYMPISFFKKFGFKEVDRDGDCVLLHLNLGSNVQPHFIYPKTIYCEDVTNLIVDIFYNSQCPWSTYMINEIRGNQKKYPEVIFNYIETNDKKIIKQHGIARGISINGKPVIKRMATWEEVESAIKRRKRKI